MKRVIESSTPPANGNVLWLDVSNDIKQLKGLINGEWVSLSDNTPANEELKKELLDELDTSLTTHINEATSTFATKTELNNKADKKIFSETNDGLVPSMSVPSDEKPTTVLTAEGKWMYSYSAAASRTKKTFLAAPTAKDGKATFRTITFEDLPENLRVDLLSYGIFWKPNVSDPLVTRVGNVSYHKSLPIQNNMKGCIAQMKDGVKIMYYLNENDWRFRRDEDAAKYTLTDQTFTAIDIDSCTGTITNEVFSTLQYEHQYIKMSSTNTAAAGDWDVFEVTSIDTSTNTATITKSNLLNSDDNGLVIITSGMLNTPISGYTIQLGAVLNGYDGEVMVEVPEFWIKSWDTDTQREVRIAPSKIDDTWEHQPQILVAAYHDTILNTVPTNMGYLSTLEADSAISVCNTNSYCRGGNNDSTYDSYLTTDKFKTMLGKPRTSIPRSTMRADARRSGKEVLSYLQYKRILYWLFVIEYATFDSQANYNAELTTEGYRQGGLSEGMTGIFYFWEDYNYSPITPNGYTNEFGNGTNVKSVKISDSSGASHTAYVSRWHGIENPFGDIGNNVDGIIINSSSIVENGKNYSEVYATDDPSLYSDSDYNSMRVIGMELNYYKGGFIKEWDLGDTAEIVPRLNGGGFNRYKCDYHWVNNDKGLRTLTLGGDAGHNPESNLYNGLGGFNSAGNTNVAAYYIGFRSSCVIA